MSIVLLCSCLTFHLRLMITLLALFYEISLSVDICAIVSLLLIHPFIKKHWRYRDFYFENTTSGGCCRQCFCFHAACVTARVAPLVYSCLCGVCERLGSVLAAPLSVQRLCRSPSCDLFWSSSNPLANYRGHGSRDRGWSGPCRDQWSCRRRLYGSTRPGLEWIAASAIYFSNPTDTATISYGSACGDPHQ